MNIIPKISADNYKVEMHKFTYSDSDYQNNIVITKIKTLQLEKSKHDQFIITVRNNSDLANYIYNGLRTSNYLIKGLVPFLLSGGHPPKGKISRKWYQKAIDVVLEHVFHNMQGD